MTYDALIFPKINGLLQLQRGILAGFSEVGQQGPVYPTQVG
jgi:hypothetical protein